MEEIWKDIEQFDGYEVSNTGKVRSKDRTITRTDGRKMTFQGVDKTLNINPNGYLQVMLSVNHKGYTKYIHRLVAEHFIDKDHDLNIVNHIDGDKMNNNVNNLEWVTYSYNSLHSYNQLLQRKPVADGMPIRIYANNIFTNELKEFKSIREAERILGISKTHIRRILDTDKNTIDGWKFSKNNVEDIERVG